MATLHKELIVDPHAPEAELHPAIKSACRDLLPGWAALADADIEIGFITGGISNALYKVGPAAAACAATSIGSAAPTDAIAPVAFRLYGDNTEQFIDRSQELCTMRLAHQHGFGPQVGRRAVGLL